MSAAGCQHGNAEPRRDRMKDITNPIAEEPSDPAAGLLALFAATVFGSAFLVFQVQPMIGKYILRWFGSTPGVWTNRVAVFPADAVGRLRLRTFHRQPAELASTGHSSRDPAGQMPEPGPLWTDDFSSVFEVVEFDN